MIQADMSADTVTATDTRGMILQKGTDESVQGLRFRRRRSRDRERGPGRRDKERRRDSSDDRRPQRRRDRDRDRDEESDGSRRDRRRRRSFDEEGSSRRKPRRERDADDGKDDGDSRRSLVKRGGPLPSQDDSFAISRGEEPEKPKEKANLGNTGVLAAASNSVAQADGSTITLKYHEPPEARKPSPKDQWKLFVFKGPDIVDTIELGTRSCWLVGRDMAVVDLPAEHPLNQQAACRDTVPVYREEKRLW